MMISIYITLYNNILHFCRKMDFYVHLCMWSIHSICIQFLNHSLPTFLPNLPTLQLSLVVFWELVCLVGLMHVDANPAQTKNREMYEILVPNTPINVCAAACLADGSNKPHLRTTQNHQHTHFVWSMQINLKWWFQMEHTLQKIYNGQTLCYFRSKKSNSLEISAYYTVLSPIFHKTKYYCNS